MASGAIDRITLSAQPIACLMCCMVTLSPKRARSLDTTWRQYSDSARQTELRHLRGYVGEKVVGPAIASIRSDARDEANSDEELQ